MALLMALWGGPLLAVPLPEPGPHAVGFRVLTGGPSDRPAQVLMWYPAQGQGTLLRYRDYVRTRWTALGGPSDEAALTERLDALRRQWTQRLGRDSQAVLDAPMRASWGAAAAAGPFPVLVYAPGVGGPADENADLFEHLASHGYWVLSSVGMGADGREVEDTLAHVEPQVRDIEALLRIAAQQAGADTGRLGLMGWSWGGMCVLFAAARDARIGAVVSLDGTREPSLTRRIDVRALRAPWLYVSRSPDTIAQIQRAGIDTTFSLLNEAQQAEVTQLIAYPMQHVDFVSRRLREASDAAYDEYSREEVGQAFGMVALYVRHFLDAHLKQAADSRRFLARKPVANGAVPHSLRIESRPAQRPETGAAH